MELTDLGWNASFEKSFEQYKTGSFIRGRVFMSERSVYKVMCKKGELNAALAGKLHHLATTKSDFPVVGDWVVLSHNENDEYAVIHAILPRQTFVGRKVSGGRKSMTGGKTDEQVIAANIDTIFIVSGLDRDFNLRRIERYLTLVYNSGAMPVMLLNKADLCDDVEEKIAEVETVAYGVPVHAFSASNKQELEPLWTYLAKGQTVALVGSSGVGKSTIINVLLGYERQRVNEISEKVGKGQHTTTHRELIMMPSGGMIIDNPGMRELQLWADDNDLEGTFSDIEEFAENCRFNDCAHESEPGCAVKQAIEDGLLDKARLESYQRLKRELHYLSERQDKSANLVEKEKWRKILKGKTLKDMRDLRKSH